MSHSPIRAALLAWLVLLLGQTFAHIVVGRSPLASAPVPLEGHAGFTYVMTNQDMTVNIFNKDFGDNTVPIVNMSFHVAGSAIVVEREMLWFLKDNKVTLEELIATLWPLSTQKEPLKKLGGITFRSVNNVETTERMKVLRGLLNMESTDQIISLTKDDYGTRDERDAARAKKEAWKTLSETPTFQTVQNIALKALAVDQNKKVTDYLKEHQPGKSLLEAVQASGKPIFEIKINNNNRLLDDIIFTFSQTLF